MDKSRDYILDRITSKKVSIDEFNFDKLSAPPLNMFLSPFDIHELHCIATSIRYSAKLKLKYEAIDKICRKRGLVKFGAGTNRVVYRHPEFPNILFKIAMDNIGMNDNPAEFKNQFILKPFVTKIFEVSPCGTVALVEKVNPITSREEFLSIAENAFALITEWLVGKYVLADIGVTTFMNFGCRSGFGVVLLDFPYVYEIDGNKLYCTRPDTNSPTGFCDGEIDYDDGFDNLICTKCGRKFHAKELEKKIKDNEIIVDREGEIKMEIIKRGGSNNINKNIVLNDNNNENFQNTTEYINRETTSDMKVESSRKKIVTLPSMGTLFNADKINNEDFNEEEFRKAGYSFISDNQDNKVFVPDVSKTVNGVSTSRSDIAECPIVIDEKVRTEALEKKSQSVEVPEKGAVETIDDSINMIIKCFNSIDIDSVKEDIINRNISKITNNIPVVTLIDKFMDIINNLMDNANDDEYVDIVSNKKLHEFIKKYYDFDILITDINNKEKDSTLVFDINAMYAYDPSSIAFIANSDKEYEILFDSENDVEIIGEKDEAVDGYTKVNANIINLRNLFPTNQNQNVIVFKDSKGNYITKDNKIVVANTINDSNVSSIKVVSAKWLEELQELANPSEEKSEEDVAEVEVINTGVLPPSGNVEETMTAEEFINSLEEDEDKTSLEV